MTDKVKLINFDRKAWNKLMTAVKEGVFDPKLAQALLDKVNSPSYWVDAARTTGFASEQTFVTFERWLNLIEQGFMESPIKDKSRPEKLAELSVASSMELFKESRDLFELIIQSGDASFVESACLEYCRRLVRTADFENAMDTAMRVGEVGGQWSQNFSPYFERLSFWNLLTAQRFTEAFAERIRLGQEEESPRLVKFEFTEPIEDEMEYVIYELAISGIGESFEPEYTIMLDRLMQVLKKRGKAEKIAEIQQAQCQIKENQDENDHTTDSAS